MTGRSVITTIIIVILIALIGYWIFTLGDPDPGEAPPQNGTIGTDNNVSVSDQAAGMTAVIDSVSLEDAGYVVVHAAGPAGPGPVLGMSAYLAAGEHEDVSVTLTRTSHVGETLYAVLHRESGGNTVFSEATDPVVVGVLGAAVMESFDITAAAGATSTPTTTP